MNIDQIRKAIDAGQKVYFCENRNGVSQIVEGLIAVAKGGEGFLFVGVAIPNGVRVAVVEAALLGRNAKEAHKLSCIRSAMFSELTKTAWEFSASKLEQVKDTKKITVSVPKAGEDVN